MRLTDPFISLPFVVEASRIAQQVEDRLARSHWRLGNEPGCKTAALIGVDDPAGPQAGVSLKVTDALVALPDVRVLLASLQVPLGVCELIHLEKGASLETEAQINPYVADRLLLLIALQPLEASMLGHSAPLSAGSVHAIDTSRAASFENRGKAGPAAILVHTLGTAALWNAIETAHSQTPRLLESHGGNQLQVETGGRRLQTADVIERHRRRLRDELTDKPAQRKIENLCRDFARDWRALEATFQPSDQAALAPFARRLNQFEDAFGNDAFDTLLANSGRPARDALTALAGFMMNPAERARFPRRASATRASDASASRPVFILGTRLSPAAALYDHLAAAPELAPMTPENRNMLSAAAPQARESEDVASARLIDLLGPGRALHQSATAMLQIDLINRAFPDALFVLCWTPPGPADADRFAHTYNLALEALQPLGRDRYFVLSSPSADTLEQLYAFLAISPLKAPLVGAATDTSTQLPPKAEPMIQRLRRAMDAQPDWQPAT